MNSPKTGMDFDLVSPLPVGPTPKVSVCMITYNHQDCIAQALDSILTQKTGFPFELIIGEDCSPDATREVILDYQRRYPEVIRLLLWRKNAGMMLNCVRTLEVCRGQYIAFCEGDDYWTDPEKLQRQVDLLESHPELALCHHEVDYVTYENGRRTRLQAFPPECHRGTRQAKHLIEENFIQTCSLMMRRAFIPVLDAEFQTLKLGDWPMCYLAAENGHIGYIDLNMADYRIHEGNNWHKLDSSIRSYEAMRMAFYIAKKAQNTDARVTWRNKGLNTLEYYLKQNSILKSWVQIYHFWISSNISLSQGIILLAGLVRIRFKHKMHRYPSARTMIKRFNSIK